MKSVGIIVLLLIGCAIAKKKECEKIKIVPHYITQYEQVPFYNTIFKEVAVAKPVPKIVKEIKLLTNYVTTTVYNPVYKTVKHPQYITKTAYEKLYKTRFETKLVPQYVTQTEYQPKFITKVVQRTEEIKVPTYITVCPYGAGGGVGAGPAVGGGFGGAGPAGGGGYGGAIGGGAGLVQAAVGGAAFGGSGYD